MPVSSLVQMLQQTTGLIANHERNVKKTVVVLVAAGVLGRFWNVGVYPPFGGMNVYLWGLGVALFLTAACQALTFLATRRSLGFLGENLPVLPIVTVSLLFSSWAAVVLSYTASIGYSRLLTFALGIGLIVAIWFAVDSVHRVRLMLGIVVLGVAVSALYGPVVTVFGDPFLTTWTILSKVSAESIRSIVVGGRMAGLSSHINALSYVLATAVPLAFAFLVSGIRLRTNGRTWSLWTGLYLVLALMLTVLLLNATRSAFLGALGGCLGAGTILLMIRRDVWMRTVTVLALVAVWLFLLFGPGVRGAERILASGPTPSDDREADGLEDTWIGRALIRASQPGWPSDESSPYEVELREKIETARELWRESRADFGLNRRIVSLDDTSARARIPMALTALRYSLEYPLGTGKYFPEPRHLPDALEPRLAEEVLTHFPHNQFLLVLVYYGYPGLALLVAFYVLIGRSLLNAARHFLRSRDEESLLLATAVTGALVGYGVNSLFHNDGPFDTDWFIYVIVGLVYSIERLSAERTSRPTAPG